MLIELLERHAEGEMVGLMFTADFGDDRHEYGFVGSYEHDPSSAFMPAAQTLCELGGVIHRGKK